MYKENDNLNKEEIDKFRSMSQAARDKLLAEKEKEVLKEKKNQKALCRNAGGFLERNQYASLRIYELRIARYRQKGYNEFKAQKQTIIDLLKMSNNFLTLKRQGLF